MDFTDRDVLGVRRAHLSARTTIVEIVGTALWGIAVVSGVFMILSFSFAPGPNTMAAVRWPGESSLCRLPGRPTLLMFAHPCCPCTKASLEQLKLILNEVHVPFDCHLVFLMPPEASEAWKTNDIVRAAELIPAVTVTRDDGKETRRFAALTSGQVFLFNAAGDLTFNGGITISRGHLGENSGGRSIIQQLNDRPTNVHQAPTFGCPLFHDVALCRGTVSCQP
jgi:hypothetical protein